MSQIEESRRPPLREPATPSRARRQKSLSADSPVPMERLETRLLWSAGGAGVIAQANQPPIIESLVDSPDPTTNDMFTLEALGVSDPEGSIDRVNFYRESNGKPGLQVSFGSGGDTLVDFDRTAPYRARVVTQALDAGTYTYYAQAEDQFLAKSNVVETTNTVQPVSSAVPGTPRLDAGSDSGESDADAITNLDNSSAARKLQFIVPDTVTGSAVLIVAGNKTLGSALGQDGSTVVTTNGAQDLADGVYDVYAAQFENGKRISRSPTSLTLTIDTAGPRVSGVVWTGSSWSPSFLSYLNAHALGEGGYLAPAGANQLQPLPWANIDTLTLLFDEATRLAGDDLSIAGLRDADYPLSDVVVSNQGRAGTWKFPQPLMSDRLTLTLSDNAHVTDRAGNLLDGEWADAAHPYPSGNGTPGGVFQFATNVLPGDFDRTEVVNAVDLVGVRNRVGRTTANPGADASSYSPFSDINADGSINASDLVLVRNRVGNRLPSPPVPLVGALTVSHFWSNTRRRLADMLLGG